MKYIIPLLFLLASCSLEKRLEKYCPLCVQESKTVTIIEYRDTTIKIPGETITLIDSLSCDSLGNVISSLDKKIMEKDGTIVHLRRSLKNNVYTSVAKVDTIYKTIRGNTVYKKEIVYKKGKDVKYVPSMINFLAYIGGISLTLLLLYVVYQIIKKRLL